MTIKTTVPTPAIRMMVKETTSHQSHTGGNRCFLAATGLLHNSQPPSIAQSYSDLGYPNAGSRRPLLVVVHLKNMFDE